MTRIKRLERFDMFVGEVHENEKRNPRSYGFYFAKWYQGEKCVFVVLAPILDSEELEAP